MGRLTVGSRRVGRLTMRALGLWMVLALALPLVPVAVAADWAQFGKPTATSSFTTGVDFRQPVTIDRPVARAELLLTIADAIGPVVIALPGAIGTGATSLTYHFDPAVDGHLYPNTRLVARWRLVSADDPADVSLGPEISLTFADDRFTWQTAAGDLVRVHWYEGPASFGQRALRIGEDAVGAVAALLGVTESEPIDFFVYADQGAFYDALGPATRENVGGAHIPGTRLMFGLITPAEIGSAWVGSVVPHELTHLVFEEAAGNPYHFPPNWLNEGLAVYLSQGYDSLDRAAVEGAAGSGTLVALDGLTGQFPTSYERFSLAYAESASALDYLVRVHGREALVSLIRSYADGRTDDEAFQAALGLDLAAFGSAWLKDLGAATPSRYGPQPAAPGPIPSAWLVEAGSSPPPAASGGTSGRPEASSMPGAGSAAGGDGGALFLGVMLAGIAIVLIGVVLARRRRVVPGPVE